MDMLHKTAKSMPWVEQLQIMNKIAIRREGFIGAAT